MHEISASSSPGLQHFLGLSAPGAGSIQGQRATVPEMGITPSKNKKELSEDNLEN